VRVPVETSRKPPVQQDELICLAAGVLSLWMHLPASAAMPFSSQ